MIDAISGSIYSILHPVLWFMFTILTMTAVYWGLVRFIALYCAPNGIYGMMMTAFTMGSPFCHAFTQILAKISEYYLVVWASIVTGFITWFVASMNIKIKRS